MSASKAKQPGGTGRQYTALQARRRAAMMKHGVLQRDILDRANRKLEGAGHSAISDETVRQVLLDGWRNDAVIAAFIELTGENAAEMFPEAAAKAVAK